MIIVRRPAIENFACRWVFATAKRIGFSTLLPAWMSMRSIVSGRIDSPRSSSSMPSIVWWVRMPDG